MWKSLIKYVSLILVLVGAGFFMMQKNLEYRKIAREERELVKKIYAAEEERRYALYELEKLKKEKNLQPGSRILVLDPFGETDSSE